MWLVAPHMVIMIYLSAKIQNYSLMVAMQNNTVFFHILNVSGPSPCSASKHTPLKKVADIVP